LLPSPNSAIGSPQLPLRRAYVRAALALIVAGATRLRARSVVTNATSENNITYQLVHEMSQAQKSGISAALLFDSRVNTSADPNDPLVRGEIDIKFRWEEYPNVHERYLAVEAKRLRGKGHSLADKYVTEGVADFVSAKYSRGHDHGIMLGYIVVAPAAAAIAKVAAAMAKRRKTTGEQSPFVYNLSLCTHPDTHQSVHQQAGTRAAITLVHLFLDFC
jgi:hypothetical protein